MSAYKPKMIEATAAILEAYTSGIVGTWQVAYSGGKDSTVTTALLFRALLMLKPEKRTRRVVITTAQTRLDFSTDPTKQREIQRMRQVIKLFNLPIEIAEVEADIENSFVFLVVGYGYCLPQGRTNRWCTERLKIEPQQKFVKQLNPSLTLIGVRMSESQNRMNSIKSYQVDKYYGENGTFMPIVDFTLDDVWAYLYHEKTPWGDAEEISQLYKDATGECGLRKRKAGAGEKVDDPCGARFGCMTCPVVTIDKSSREMAKKYPWFQPYVELRDIMIQMYNEPDNRAGYRRNGVQMFYGEGNFNIRARMMLFDQFMQAQLDNEYLAQMHNVESQQIFFSDKLIARIQEQWKIDAEKSPWLLESEDIGLFFEQRPKGVKGGKKDVPGQLTWNTKSADSIHAS